MVVLLSGFCLMGEPLIALRAKDRDTFKQWLYVGMQDLGEPAVTELLLGCGVAPGSKPLARMRDREKTFWMQ